MNEYLKRALTVSFCFAWPVGLQFTGKEPVTFQVAVISSLSGIAYFSTRAWLGHLPIGTFSLWPATVMAACGVLGAYGMEQYVPLLKNPKYVGVALALANTLIIFGTAFMIWQKTGHNSISTMNAFGVLVISLGVYMMNLK